MAAVEVEVTLVLDQVVALVQVHPPHHQNTLEVSMHGQLSVNLCIYVHKTSFLDNTSISLVLWFYHFIPWVCCPVVDWSSIFLSRTRNSVWVDWSSKFLVSCQVYLA